MDILHAHDIASGLEDQRDDETLCVVTCGGAGDGKSTLVDRLQSASTRIIDDRPLSLQDPSRRCRARGEKLDLAMLADGPGAQREHGNASDVAHRFFATGKRRFIVADAPGHEQCTRTMATGASTADLALVVIDARKGVLTQTRRHSRIVALMGIRHVLLAVNKMDLVDFDQACFDGIVAAYREFAAGLGFSSLQAIPLCARDGDNLLQHGARMPWYAGPTLMACLDTVEAGSATPRRDAFRMPVESVDRTNQDFRGFCGRIAEGELRPGDELRVLPSGVRTRVKSILAGFEEVPFAQTGDAVTVTLADEIDAGRGDVLVASENPPEVADQFEAKLLWMAEHAMVPGRQYLLKLACTETTATVTAIKYREDVDSGARLAAKTLGLNEIATVNISTGAPLVFEPYGVNRRMGGFILIDKLSFETAGAGMIDFALRRASNIHWQALGLDKAARAALMRQKPKCVWFTGLSGSGKSTIANLLEKRLHAAGKHTYLLDGDNIRHGLNRDLGFTEADRVENIRRVAEVARLMVDAGLIVLVSFISPFRNERRMARAMFAADEFVEVFVDTPLDECERRDAKGLYAKARSGRLKNFTGIDSPYETPERPEVHLRTAGQAPDFGIERLLDALD